MPHFLQIQKSGFLLVGKDLETQFINLIFSPILTKSNGLSHVVYMELQLGSSDLGVLLQIQLKTPRLCSRE